jgi:hypothetical protein
LYKVRILAFPGPFTGKFSWGLCNGVVPSVQNPRFNYYLGGRYIPGPLKITKHFGSGNIGTIANEILELTKVNWNSFDMYTQLPARTNSSHEIAGIGRLLSKREGTTYDYRYLYRHYFKSHLLFTGQNFTL